VSWSRISIEELDNIIPVSPPIVKRAIKPNAHQSEGEAVILVPYKVLNQLNTLIPVGMAMIIVAAVK
jgi:hypothetical protein